MGGKKLMYDFKPDIWCRLIDSKSHIATEVEPKTKQNRKWIAIYPTDKEDYKYRIFEIELPAKIIEQELDWFDDDEITKEYYVKNELELILQLQSLKINPSDFVLPYSCEYPYH